MKIGFMIQYGLLCPLPGAFGDFPYSIHLERGMLTYAVEVTGIPDKSWFVGLYLERETFA